MTLAEKLRMEGKLEGLIEGLELVISLKYPEKASQIIGVINQIKDIALLKKLKEMIAESYTPSEIMAWLVSNEPEKCTVQN